MMELAFDLLTNKYDESHGVASCSTDRQGNIIAVGTGAPGSKSPPRRASPRTLAKKHVLVPLKSIVSWTGTSAQLNCAICSTKTTMVCVECSDATSVVPLCKRVHTYQERTVVKQCLKRHWEAPNESRRAYSRSLGKKRDFSEIIVQAELADE